MADSNAVWTRREQIELDGIPYDVGIEHAGSDFTGKWHCQRCGARGDTTLKSQTPDQALERAKVSVFAHHTLAHGDQAIES
jgi:hypothetical protein